MTPHPRIRKTIKWGGAVVSAVLFVAWIGSGWRQVGWVTTLGNWVILHRGRVFLAWQDMVMPSHFPHGAVWRPEWGPFTWTFSFEIGNPGSFLYVPLWAPLAVALAFTAAAWRYDSRARRREFPHLCTKCTYDRAGLAPGTVCPECGAAALSASIKS